MNRTSGLKTLSLWSLVGVNAVLASTFAGHLWRGNAAVAQANGAPGDYLMIPGTVIGGTNGVVYVVNQTTHQLSAMSYDDAMKQLVTMEARDLVRDFDARGVAGGPGGAGRGQRR